MSGYIDGNTEGTKIHYEDGALSLSIDGAQGKSERPSDEVWLEYQTELNKRVNLDTESARNFMRNSEKRSNAEFSRIEMFFLHSGHEFGTTPTKDGIGRGCFMSSILRGYGCGRLHQIYGNDNSRVIWEKSLIRSGNPIHCDRTMSVNETLKTNTALLGNKFDETFELGVMMLGEQFGVVSIYLHDHQAVVLDKMRQAGAAVTGASMTKNGFLQTGSSSATPISPQKGIFQKNDFGLYDLCNDIPAPYTFIMGSAKDGYMVAQRLSPLDEAQVSRLSPGVCYRLTDYYLLPPLHPDNPLAEKVLAELWVRGEAGFSDQRTRLRRSIFWNLDRTLRTPVDPNRFLVTLWQSPSLCRVKVDRSLPREQHKTDVAPEKEIKLVVAANAVVGEPQKPKGYMAAFNIFVKAVRSQVILEPGVSNKSNNDINKLLGQRWGGLSTEEKNKYEIKSLVDKDRYLRECKIYNDQTNKTETIVPRIKFAGYEALRTVTEYETFKHSERQFVEKVGTDIQRDLQKYFALRWATMSSGEKEMYKCYAAVEEIAFTKRPSGLLNDASLSSVPAPTLHVYAPPPSNSNASSNPNSSLSAKRKVELELETRNMHIAESSNINSITSSKSSLKGKKVAKPKVALVKAAARKSMSQGSQEMSLAAVIMADMEGVEIGAAHAKQIITVKRQRGRPIGSKTKPYDLPYEEIGEEGPALKVNRVVGRPMGSKKKPYDLLEDGPALKAGRLRSETTEMAAVDTAMTGIAVVETPSVEISMAETVVDVDAAASSSAP